MATRSSKALDQFAVVSCQFPESFWRLMVDNRQVLVNGSCQFTVARNSNWKLETGNWKLNERVLFLCMVGCCSDNCKLSTGN